MKSPLQTTCDVCGKPGARARKVTRTYGKGDDLLVIENVPVVSCPHCGETYLTAPVLRRLDRIRTKKKTPAVVRPVAVIAY